MSRKLWAESAAHGAIAMQVGDPWKDHDCWERPEDMDTERTVYNVSAGRPGSDIAGETAAALAAASMVFRDDDPEYAETLLASARKAFEFADTYKGAYSDDPDLRAGGCPFYCDFNGYQVRCLSRFPASASRWRHDLCSSASSQVNKKAQRSLPCVSQLR